MNRQEYKAAWRLARIRYGVYNSALPAPFTSPPSPFVIKTLWDALHGEPAGNEDHNEIAYEHLQAREQGYGTNCFGFDMEDNKTPERISSFMIEHSRKKRREVLEALDKEYDQMKQENRRRMIEDLGFAAFHHIHTDDVPWIGRDDFRTQTGDWE